MQILDSRFPTLGSWYLLVSFTNPLAFKWVREPVQIPSTLSSHPCQLSSFPQNKDQTMLNPIYSTVIILKDPNVKILPCPNNANGSSVVICESTQFLSMKSLCVAISLRAKYEYLPSTFSGPSQRLNSSSLPRTEVWAANKVTLPIAPSPPPLPSLHLNLCKRCR